MNFAPLLYLNIMAEHGGPIEKVSTIRSKINFVDYGYQSVSYLSKNLISHRAPDCYLYSNSDGTGSDIYQKLSVYKSISESLERWCFYETFRTGLFGFSIDPTTNGMAAYPSLFSSRSAREIAYVEAFERWSLVQWWFGHMSNTEVQSFDYGNVFYIYSKNASLVTAVLFTACQNKRFCYGFAGGVDKRSAFCKALIEFKRNYELVSQLSTEQCDRITFGANMFEKRLLYFSESKNHSFFLEKIKENRIHKEPKEKLLVDSKIKGPWSKYTVVWRCLFEPIDIDDLSKVNVFLF